MSARSTGEGTCTTWKLRFTSCPIVVVSGLSRTFALVNPAGATEKSLNVRPPCVQPAGPRRVTSPAPTQEMASAGVPTTAIPISTRVATSATATFLPISALTSLYGGVRQRAEEETSYVPLSGQV